MKKLATGFFMSWGMFCALPCPCRRWDENLRPQMVAFFPAVGGVLGLLWAAVALLLSLAGGLGAVGAVLLTLTPYLLTGFIHLDGFMDCCDAILSRRSMERKREILKDSHVGAFAVICFGSLLLLTAALFFEMQLGGEAVWQLAFIAAAARCPSALSVLYLRAMPGSSYEKTANTAGKGCGIAVGIELLAAVALAMVVGGRTGLCAAAAAAGAAIAICYGVRQLGGMSGDISGFAVTIGEVCGIAALMLLRS